MRLYYGCFISLLITFSLLINHQSFNPAALILILPLSFYFFPAAYWQTIKNQQFWAHYGEQLKTTPLLLVQSKFSLLNFLTQPNFTFRLSLILFLIILGETLTQPTARLISPLP